MTGNESSRSASYGVHGCHKVAIRLPLQRSISDYAAYSALTGTVLRQCGIRAPVTHNCSGYVYREKKTLLCQSTRH